MLQYQYEDAVKAKLWKKILAVVLAAVLVIGTLAELLCQTSMVKDRLEVSAMMSSYTKEIVDTSEYKERITKGKAALVTCDEILVSLRKEFRDILQGKIK